MRYFHKVRKAASTKKPTRRQGTPSAKTTPKLIRQRTEVGKALMPQTKKRDNSLNKSYSNVSAIMGDSPTRRSSKRPSAKDSPVRQTSVLNSPLSSKPLLNAQQANVKVIARFRPLNKMETEMMESGVGAECCKIVDNTIYFFKDEIYFSFDMVMDSGVSQEKVYEDVGKSTVEDVLSGYNGTIFAYGQTGTGKSYTMFGPNIHHEAKGIIPRAAMDTFKVWEMWPEVKEVEVRCSMVEIYKETLNDLLADECADLKIKESPARGVYVEGLSEIPVASEEELTQYLEMGEARRAWRATRHNLVSSRSHTIFILEVRQTLNDDSEKCGKLNLVDLAGSEKVGKSGLRGQQFAEGTKINLSLSVLGNVIHALGTKLDYIPYRDSKLTRLLQESLGGNYKTTLIVTCSSHSSQLQETLSTLKFAQRAKKLRNKVQINIKSSPEDLIKATQKLKQELEMKNSEIDKLKGLLTDKDSQLTFTTSYKMSLIKTSSNNKAIEIDQAEDTPTIKLSSEFSNLLEENTKLKAKLKDAAMRVENLSREKVELEQKVIAGEIAIAEEKKKALFTEKKFIDLQRLISTKEYSEEKSIMQRQEKDIELKVLRNQLKALNEAIEDCEWECFKLMKEKKEQLAQDSIKLYDLNLSDFIDKDTSTEKWVNDLNSVDLLLAESLIGPKKLFANQRVVSLDGKQLVSSSKYAESIGTAIVDEQISMETLNYLLRIQLIDASVVNHNLRRVISMLVRKLHIERANARVKSELCTVLQKSVDSLEKLLKKTSGGHQNWKDKMDKLDFELDSLKHLLESRKSNESRSSVKARIRKPMRYKPSVPKTSTEKSSLQEGDLESVHSELEESQRIKKMHEPIKTERQSNCRNNELSRPDTVDLIKEPGYPSNLKFNYKENQLEELEVNLREKQIELDWHKTLTDLLMAELAKTRKLANDLKAELEELKRSSEQAIHDEIKNWQLATSALKANYDKELIRKQRDTTAVHELLAQWVVKYMNLEKAKGVEESDSVRKLLREYVWNCG
eukprot:TRINITY_DN3414_c0_g2_i1.p1 TRINITY_DN3414_c0_g2~~TRINITY_DN3414_c0_g2_i1.p1  ORF type:complete len:1020 (+),score=257.08 TRINITY_DN3414_c0_g2_i1:221-3280(+)